MGSYTYLVQYKPGKELQHADGLSRLPLPDTLKSVPIPPEMIHLVDILNSSPITVSDIKSCTATDPILSKVATLVSRGWKNNIGTGEDFTPYSRRYSELSIVDGCVLCGSRVITPPKLWEGVLDEIHKSHPGIVKMKAIARSYVWWLKLDDDMEKKVSSCDVCQLSRNSPPPALLHTWE